MKKKESLKLGSTMLSSAWLFCISTASYNLLNKAKDLPVINNPVLLFDNFSYKSEDSFYFSTSFLGEYYFKIQNLSIECSGIMMLRKNSQERLLECNRLKK
jgi:hypothetical protein